MQSTGQSNATTNSVLKLFKEETMCGIYGYIGTPKRINETYRMMKAMAIATEVRGTHSAGIAGITKENLFCTKMTVPASEFYENVDVHSVIKNGAYFFIGHNRWASMGNITEENAHPFVGEKYLFAHNGTVPLAKNITDKLELQTDGDTDSESLMVLSEKFGLNALKEFNDLSIVAIDYRSKNEAIYFYRDWMKPMVICDLRDAAGIILFASTKEIIKKGIEEMTAINVRYFLNKTFETKIKTLYSYNKNGTCKISSLKKTNSELKATIKEIYKEHKKETKNKRREKIYYADYTNYWTQSGNISREFGKIGGFKDDETRLFDGY
jgi:predicted glutamine amidotransferase